jgi:hypothetical protein
MHPGEMRKEPTDKLGSYLARRDLLARALGIGALSAILLVPLKLLRPDRVELYFIITGALGIAAMFAIAHAVVRCPKCGASLFLRAPRGVFCERYVGACPRCGASFDQPV